MVQEFLMSLITPLVMLIIAGIGGYLVFRTNQTNKNTALEAKFQSVEKDMNSKFFSVEKDIGKNDQRLRKEFHEQNQRNEKTYDKFDSQLDVLKSNVTLMMQNDVETKLMLSHFDETMKGVSDKVDLIFKSIVSKEI